MSHPVHPVCCTLPPVQSTYTPQGQITQVDGMDIYVVGPNQATKYVIINYDIFGMHPNTQQSADLLSKGLEAKVVMPDFVLGKPWSLANFPPKNPQELGQWFQTEGAWTTIHPRLQKVLAWCKQHGAKQIGYLGFCWGGKMASMASIHCADQIQAVALVHPAMVDEADATAAKRPWCILPSKDEPDMKKVQEILHTKPWGKDCVMQRFDDMHHGWCAARADFNNELNRKRTHEALEILASFFKRTLV